MSILDDDSSEVLMEVDTEFYKKEYFRLLKLVDNKNIQKELDNVLNEYNTIINDIRNDFIEYHTNYMKLIYFLTSEYKTVKYNKNEYFIISLDNNHIRKLNEYKECERIRIKYECSDDKLSIYEECFVDRINEKIIEAFNKNIKDVIDNDLLTSISKNFNKYKKYYLKDNCVHNTDNDSYYETINNLYKNIENFVNDKIKLKEFVIKFDVSKFIRIFKYEFDYNSFLVKHNHINISQLDENKFNELNDEFYTVFNQIVLIYFKSLSKYIECVINQLKNITKNKH